MESDMMQPIDDASYNEPAYEQTHVQPQDSLPHHYDTYYPRAPIGPVLPSKDLFSGIDKNTWILLLVAFIIGFFMGKTMQPVIIRGG